MPATGWEHLSHQADIGVRGFGPTREAAFEQTALALTTAVCDPGSVAATRAVAVTATGGDDESLLVAWLNALIFEMATRRMLFSRFDVTIDGTRLRATAWGEEIDVARHAPAVEVKGATYTGLRVAEENGVWSAECVIDV
ncbi:MAG TPA: archease [Alphaproteobacteria bacterium]|nr:archease [Alphaproteobacteria bacterium]